MMQKLITYYNEYLQAQRMYLELADKRWILGRTLLNAYYMHINIPIKYISENDLLDKLNIIHDHHTKYEALHPQAYHRIQIAINRLNNLSIKSIYINSQSHTIDIDW